MLSSRINLRHKVLASCNIQQCFEYVGEALRQHDFCDAHVVDVNIYTVKYFIKNIEFNRKLIIFNNFNHGMALSSSM